MIQHIRSKWHNMTNICCGCAVVCWLACWIVNREVWGSNPGQGKNLYRDFCSSCGALSQLNYDEYTDRTLSVGRERIGHPPSYAEAKNMKLLRPHTQGCPTTSLRGCSSLYTIGLAC